MIRASAFALRSMVSIACTLMAGEHQTHDYYMTIGPMFADPVAAAVR